MYTGFLYIGILLASAFAAQRMIGAQTKRIPYLTLALCAILAACFLLQLEYPSLLSLLERDASMIEAGQWWRLLTALFFQDGGIGGAVSNILLLLLVGSLAEQVWKRSYWLVIYFCTGFAAECAGLFLQPLGAGNSVAIFGLAASIFAVAYARKAALPARALGAISGVAALALLLEGDIHGAAFWIGLFVSFCMLRYAKMPSRALSI